MPLADRYTKPDTRTKFQKWLDSLKPAHRAVIEDWFADTTISNAKLVELIRDDDPADGFVGYRANKDSISAHRRMLRGN